MDFVLAAFTCARVQIGGFVLLFHSVAHTAFGSADRVLDFTLGFVSFAFRLKLGVTDDLASRVLDDAFCLVGHADVTPQSAMHARS